MSQTEGEDLSHLFSISVGSAQFPTSVDDWKDTAEMVMDVYADRFKQNGYGDFFVCFFCEDGVVFDRPGEPVIAALDLSKALPAEGADFCRSVIRKMARDISAGGAITLLPTVAVRSCVARRNESALTDGKSVQAFARDNADDVRRGASALIETPDFFLAWIYEADGKPGEPGRDISFLSESSSVAGENWFIWHTKGIAQA